MPDSHRPERMCAACRARGSKAGFYRLVRSADNFIALDKNQKAPGRGLYLCKNLACLGKAEKSRVAERTLRAELPKDFYAELSKLLEDING